MRCDFSMGNTRMKFIAGAVLMSLASVAGAQSLVGGGATLPAIGYTGSATAPTNLPITPGAGSLLKVYGDSTSSATTATYCPTGSGAGKKILAGNDATAQVNNACTTANLGFGGTGLTQADFAGSDAPMSVTEYSAYQTGHASTGTPVQFPAISGAIAITFNKTGVSTLTLTEGQICGIFSGQIKTWNDTALTGAGIPAGVSGNINVVYRNDNSGTSFSFLNHLSAVCPLAANVATGKLAATQFKTAQSFWNGTGASAYIGSYASALPTNGATGGNAGLVAAVNATDGSIGYAEAANPITAPARFASVKNTNSGASVNPATGFGTTALPVSLSFGVAIADAPDANGRPILTALAGSPQCVAVVDPSAYANPTSGYPILAVTYLLGNGQNNGTRAAGVKGLLFSPYNKTTRPSVTKIGRVGTGYSWLSDSVVLDSTDATTGIQARLNSCVN
jgi:ABC-type phosphate transport system substrate-binding protein